MADDSLEVHFLDVGQGDGTLIIFPKSGSVRQTMLVDLGSKKNADVAGMDAISFLKDTLLKTLKRKVIDYVILTHGDGDHYNLIPDLIDAVPGINFGEVCYGGTPGDYDSTTFNKIRAAATQVFNFNDNAFNNPTSPYWNSGGANVYLLAANYPRRNYFLKNPKSVVLMVEYQARKVILTGDAEHSTEEAILSHFNSGTKKNPNYSFLQCEVLKLGHHGSKAASSVNFIKALQLKLAFASADMRWGHPYLETLDRIKVNVNLRKNLYQHQYLCGYWVKTKYAKVKWKGRQIYKKISSGYNDWQQFNDKLSFYSNIYKVDDAGMAYGVHYLFRVNKNATMYLGDTLDNGINFN